ncbi:MAG: sodium ion-translocating decarboxylase subunit beta, partial [Chlorobiaceae bacterium]|nr:sodium ion-translocating decarboxylase subunit beta [Chlorobiaceae bacterium]
MEGITRFFEHTGFAGTAPGHLLMIFAGLLFIWLAIRFEYEPFLLVPIGFGMIIGNIPLVGHAGLQIALQEEGSVMNYFYMGVLKGIFPPLIFLGIGAMTDFSPLISNPKLILLGAAAQLGIFLTYIGAITLGFGNLDAAAIGIIGGADGPTAIFLSSRLAPHLIGSITIAAYIYMALVPIIQPPVMKLLTTEKERKIRMKPPRSVSRREKVFFPIIGVLLTGYIAPASLPLLGMLFLGNLLRESMVTARLADTARNSLFDTVSIVLGVTLGASADATTFLTRQSLQIFILGAGAFIISTAGGILFAKIMNLFLSEGSKVNPLIGAAGVSAVPNSAKVAHREGIKADPSNHLIMHAMAPNVA